MKATTTLTAFFLAGVHAFDPHQETRMFQDGPDTHDFHKYMKVFNKNYDGFTEQEKRKQIYMKNHELIEKHNAGKHSWVMGVNQFSDMTDDEFEEKILMAPQECSATAGTHTNQVSATKAQQESVPKSIDWRERGVISAVKNQGHCGSCWTFSTTGALEAHLAIINTPVGAPRISEQQLVDCAKNYDNNGCSGGLPSHAFEYIKDNGGLSTEFTYPYLAKDHKNDPNIKCHSIMKDGVEKGTGPLGLPLEIGVKVLGGAVNITENDEVSAAHFMAKKGPVSMSYQCLPEFKNYKYGVYTTDKCPVVGPKKVNHAVLGVGYGYDYITQLDYWTIKNSWSPVWGDHGFFKIERGANMCSIGVCNSLPDLIGNVTKVHQEPDLVETIETFTIQEEEVIFV